MLDSFPFLVVQIFRIAKHYASSALNLLLFYQKKGRALSYRRGDQLSLEGIYLKLFSRKEKPSKANFFKGVNKRSFLNKIIKSFFYRGGIV
ncbi:hypothetical protein DB42_AA00300 [Neochlamydia sp. EPS4]|nr:hypothetical protein DB42_AA00300 [Neochlamydia sp. EPS4]